MKIEDKISPHQKQRRVKKYGDLVVVNRILTSKNWNLLLSKKKFGEGLSKMIGSSLGMLIAGLASIGNLFFRYRFGSQTLGFLLMAMTTNIIWIANTTEIAFYSKPLLFWSTPILPFFYDSHELTEFVFQKIHSKNLMVILFGYWILGLVHLVLIYLGKGHSQDRGKRGESYLYQFAFKKSKVSEYTVQGLMEPILIGLIGLLSYQLGDITLATILWLSAGSGAFQDGVDHALQLTLKEVE